MPKYEVITPKGKRFQVESPTPLTPAQLQDLLARVERAPAAAWQGVDTSGITAFERPVDLRDLPTQEQWEAMKRKIEEEHTGVGGLLRSLYGLLNIPLAAASSAVGATLTRGGEVFGKEAGKPRQVAKGDWGQRFFSIYSPETEWGAILEATVPGIPRPVRQAGAVVADLLLDPLAYVTPAKVGQALRLGRPSAALSRVLGINAAAAAESKAPTRAAGLLLHLLLEPRVTAAAVREGMTAPAGSRLTSMFRSLAQAQALRRAVAEKVAPGAAANVTRAVRHDYRGVPEEVIQAAERAAQALPEKHPDAQALRRVQASMASSGTGHAYTKSGDVETVYRLAREAGFRTEDTPVFAISELVKQFELNQGKLSAAAKEEARRLTELSNTRPGELARLLSLWKATKTIYNLPSYPRNFVQNFVLRYLEGQPMPLSKTLQAFWRYGTDPALRQQLWQATEMPAGRMAEVGSTGVLRRLNEWLGQKYEGMDRAAASLLSLMTGKPAREFMMNYGDVPASIDFVRRTGLAPFISWYYFAVPAVARGLVDQPHRTRRALQVLLTSQPDEGKQGEYVGLPGGREVRAEAVLPFSPADLGPESSFLDPAGLWISPLILGLVNLSQGKGYRPPLSETKLYGAEGLARLLLDWAAPPWTVYYLPGLASTLAGRQQQREGARRPRQLVDYLLSLAGLPVRPVDREADERARVRQQQMQMQRLRERIRNEIGRRGQ